LRKIGLEELPERKLFDALCGIPQTKNAAPERSGVFLDRRKWLGD
jgi:hypothetical protein